MSRELEELQEIARLATCKALESYDPIPQAWRDKLTIGTFFDGDYRIFELYVPGEKPSDAIIVSSARVNRNDRSVEVVISNLENRKAHKHGSNNRL